MFGFRARDGRAPEFLGYYKQIRKSTAACSWVDKYENIHGRRSDSTSDMSSTATCGPVANRNLLATYLCCELSDAQGAFLSYLQDYNGDHQWSWVYLLTLWLSLSFDVALDFWRLDEVNLLPQQAIQLCAAISPLLNCSEQTATRNGMFASWTNELVWIFLLTECTGNIDIYHPNNQCQY